MKIKISTDDILRRLLKIFSSGNITKQILVLFQELVDRGEIEQVETTMQEITRELQVYLFSRIHEHIDWKRLSFAIDCYRIEQGWKVGKPAFQDELLEYSLGRIIQGTQGTLGYLQSVDSSITEKDFEKISDKVEVSFEPLAELANEYHKLVDLRNQFPLTEEEEKHLQDAEKRREILNRRKRFGNADPVEIKESINLVDFIGRFVKLHRSGSKFKGLCPFHKEKTPSFVVSQKSFKCYGCGNSGDVFSFIMKLENLGFKDAVKRVLEIS